MIGGESWRRVWIRSSHSGNTGGECLELALGETEVLVRDSKGRHDAVLTFRHAAWCGFLSGLADPGADGS
ncbi:DUF397 domain-containing protein [Streptomyces spinoverrucosus]|uniref:DUF397 domain-containing protein n=1 Tax=Streptomyces spinoverrucosus TaxID=284043 RepID=UPI0018C38635|nr:DUF397 domain-containing protein [Streptomyces spinoverrucosus]MBG0856336.1 DUF397 domain-containing protein [Streptomyces spinoverrucosus]